MTRRVFGGLLAATLLAGCRSSTVTTKTVTTGGSATSTSSTTVSTATTTAAPDTTSATIPGPPVPVGRTVLLSYSSVIGQEPDTQLSVRVTKVFPIPASDYVQLGAPISCPTALKSRSRIMTRAPRPMTTGLRATWNSRARAGRRAGQAFFHRTAAPAPTTRRTTTSVSTQASRSTHA